MLLCVRTTIELNDELFRQAKRKAAAEKITLRELVERALRLHLEGRDPRAGYRLALVPFRGRGLQDGVSPEDLADRDRLLDLMEGRR
jgi:hypothetical protein